MTILKKPELLAPAGNMEKGKMAFLYGADAVYLGGKMFGLRAFADNFSLEEIEEITEFAHNLGRKVYVTVNIFAHNNDIYKLPQYLSDLEMVGADALIVSDLGVFTIARRIVPYMPLHVSTQANITNYEAVLAWKKMGAKRVVLARELSFKEIKEIVIKTDTELEAFVHGAMCISYSGRCLLSNYLAGRDSNRGACVQACRWEYTLMEKTRPDKFFDIAEDNRGTYIMNSGDLCLIDYIPQLISAGVSSFKIEGRMKSIHYVATVVSVYRKAIDIFISGGEKDSKVWHEELEKVSHRPYTTAFFLGKPDSEAQTYNTSSYERTYDFVGIVIGYDEKLKRAYFEQRNHVAEGEVLEVLMPDGRICEMNIKNMQDEGGNPISYAPHAQMKFSSSASEKLLVNSLARRKL